MQQWIDESGTKLLGLIGFLTVLNTLLLVGLYMRLEPSEVQATEPEEAQLTGEAPTQPLEQPQGVPIQTANVAEAFQQLLEPFASDSEGLKLPTDEQLRRAIETKDFHSEESQAVFRLIQTAYEDSKRPLPPIQ